MATGEQIARAENYRDAAAERITVALELYGTNRWVESVYLAGLAVECMLRAYRHLIDPRFDARHNLDKLYDLAKFADIVPRSDRDHLVAAMETVTALWANDYRYIPEAELKARWLAQGLNKRGNRWIKGDFLKERTRELMNSATKIVNTGVAKWKLSSKS